MSLRYLDKWCVIKRFQGFARSLVSACTPISAFCSFSVVVIECGGIDEWYGGISVRLCEELHACVYVCSIFLDLVNFF